MSSDGSTDVHVFEMEIPIGASSPGYGPGISVGTATSIFSLINRNMVVGGFHIYIYPNSIGVGSMIVTFEYSFYTTSPLSPPWDTAFQ
jgi:hypothetical protein